MPLPSDAERLSLALAAAKLGDWSWDAASDAVLLSPRAAAVFDVPADTHTTRAALRHLLHPDDSETVREAVDKALRNRTDYALEYRIVCQGGERWVWASGRGIYDDRGAVVGMLGVVQDITGAMRAREALQRRADALHASEERYRAFVEHSSEGIWRLEFEPPLDTTLSIELQVADAYANGRLAECNAVMARMYGLESPDQLIGKTLDFMLPFDDPGARAYIASIVEAGYRVSGVESKERDAQGRIKYFSNSMSGIVVDGKLHRIWGTQRDITGQKEVEQAQAYLAAIVDSADDAILSKNLDGIIQSCNAGCERIFGFKASELIGLPVRVLIPPERQSEEDDILSRLRGGQRVEHFETVRLRKDGRRIDVSLTISPVRDASGAIVGASKIVRDITEQKRAAAALAAQQAWFRITLSSIGDAVIACDPQGRVTFVNGTAERLTGWNEAEATGRPLHEVFHIVNERTREGVDNPAMIVMKLGHVVGLANHTLLLARDGRERPIADSAAPIRDAEGRMLGVVLVFRDVTDERRAEDALAEQREWLEKTLESIGDAVIATDVQGRIVFMNPVAEYLTGWRAESARGRAFQEVFRAAGEQSRHLPDDPIGRVMSGGTVSGSGSQVLLVATNGSERAIDQSGAPIRNRDGRIIGVVVVFRDVSERRRVELDRQAAASERDRLLDAERVARADAERASRIKDEFVAMVSHELRTPLNAILGWTQLMMRGKNDPATVERGLDIIGRNTRLQAQLVSDLLDISRIVSGKLQLEVQQIDLPGAVTEAVETLRQEANAKGVALRLRSDADGAALAGDSRRLQQILSNLLSNAVKFTPSGGSVDVTLRRRGSAAEIVVSDTGAGIKADVLPHVFDRFHQADRSITRRFGGLGLGLSIVKHLVELHGGSVSVASAGEGQGASFTVVLPVSSSAMAPPRVEAPASDPLPAESLDAMRVLVVEDEPDTREFLKRLLESHGAEVLTAGTADEAFDSFASWKPDLLLSDIGLPIVDGYDLMRRIRNELPERGRMVPAIALTAYARTDDRTRALRAGFQAHIAKPVEASELLVTIASFSRLLDQRR